MQNVVKITIDDTELLYFHKEKMSCWLLLLINHAWNLDLYKAFFIFNLGLQCSLNTALLLNPGMSLCLVVMSPRFGTFTVM